MPLSGIRYRAPAPGGAAGVTPLKPPAKTDPQRLTRKNVAFLQSLPLALVPVRGAFGLVTLADCARGRHLLTSWHCQAWPVLSWLPDRVDEWAGRLGSSSMALRGLSTGAGA
jgi:hypothetical protein